MSTNKSDAPSKATREQMVARIRAAREQWDELVRDTVSHAGLDPRVFVDKGIPQSRVFMLDVIPLLHRLYEPEPEGARKTLLDVGPQNFAGTAMLAELHGRQSFTRLKLDVTAIDLHDKFALLKELIAPSVEFIVGDLYKVEGRAWDTVVASHVVEHVPNPLKFVRRLQAVAKDYVIIACPWNENPLKTKGHINTIDKAFVRELGARDLRIFTSYTWGKEREVCLFWLDGTASQAK